MLYCIEYMRLGLWRGVDAAGVISMRKCLDTASCSLMSIGPTIEHTYAYEVFDAST